MIFFEEINSKKFIKKIKKEWSAITATHSRKN